MSKFDIKNYVNPHITTLEDFNSQYKESIQNPSSFFLKKAISYLSWFQEPTIGYNGSFEEPKWFEDARGFKNLETGLKKTGFNDEETNKILGNNWFNFYKGIN